MEAVQLRSTIYCSYPMWKVCSTSLLLADKNAAPAETWPLHDHPVKHSGWLPTMGQGATAASHMSFPALRPSNESSDVRATINCGASWPTPIGSFVGLLELTDARCIACVCRVRTAVTALAGFVFSLP